VSGSKNLTSRLILCGTDSTIWFKIVIYKLLVTVMSQCMYKYIHVWRNKVVYVCIYIGSNHCKV